VHQSPLLETIFEIKWEIEKRGTRPPFDPNYKIFIGRIFDRVMEEYPHHIALPSSTMPDEISAYIIQHQFRKDKDQWPLIQVGQGIITLNDTGGYSWKDFRARAENLIRILFDAYPNSSKMKISNLLLRYINGRSFNFKTNDPRDFLERLHCNVNFNEEFFEITGAKDNITSFDIGLVFPVMKPKGVIQNRFTRGMVRGQEAIIWECGVHSMGVDVPKQSNEILKWLDIAHEIPHKWFDHIKDKIGD